MLNQHHGDVVAFLRVGQVEDRLASGLEPDRLIVEHSVGDIVVALFDREIGRFPGFRQSRAEPAARRLASGVGDHFAGFTDIGTDAGKSQKSVFSGSYCSSARQLAPDPCG